MINQIHARLYRPESGWDPVPAGHAVNYAQKEWRSIDETLLGELGRWIGGFEGKRVLDLGGGPGQYSAAFARRGAEVTWHDVSRRYRDMARERVAALGLDKRVSFSLGYMDEAPVSLPGTFDFVFNRVCWCYGFGDSSLAKVLYQLARPGGWIYVDTNHSDVGHELATPSWRFRTWLNDRFAIKIGHPYPPHGRVAELFLGFPLQQLFVDYRSPTNDRILLQKVGNSP